jgi:hypothetical protein
MDTRIEHLDERQGWWVFTFKPAQYHDFAGLLAAFKTMIPMAERAWDEEARRWSVLITEENEARLRMLFNDFGTQLRALRNQMNLFAMENERDAYAALDDSGGDRDLSDAPPVPAFGGCTPPGTHQ